VPFLPAGATPEFVLEPFDQVLILPQPNFELPQQVRIEGEVAQPGSYTLLSKDERVIDLIERAGGLLPSGHADGARLFRDLDDMGRINLDLPTALADRGHAANILIQSGDSLFIPEYSPTVQVTGAVNSPVTVMWEEGRGLDYYIANAGGYRSDADKGGVSVRYANGGARTRSKFLFFSSYPEPGPGSSVLVPSKDPAAASQWATILGPIVSGVGTVAALIIAVTR
jgi:protein involved in polysaccharide export with SLBB domain